jgi:NTP pyrophosphatase (non-canonical NTP hydrolase)|tara:strand:- start:36 stop:407 length:372 start_codon:yes stop_codon:yes gene_type:complete
MNLEIEAKEFLKRKNMSNITATEYQKKAKETAIFPADKALEYLSLGLVGEAGEVANKVKKLIRDKKVLLDTTVISSEIGDVLWYCAMLADYLDVNLGKIMDDNLDKLKSRKQRGTLGGTGDNR